MTGTNLPLELTSFVGREHELQLIATRLGKAHLVTLTGTGGCGKTRLACQVARRRRRAYPGGVWLIELGNVTDGELIVETVAQVVGVPEPNSSGQSLLVRLIQELRTRSVLLVLDNCEHLLDACAVLAVALLRECPRLHVLATSRQALGVTGEAIVRVPSLALPSADATTDLTALGRIESVRLFVDRASARNQSFGLDRHTAPAVVDICRRLDGIPLALELAAAWVHVLAPDQLAARLDDQFQLLTGGGPAAPRRHQTLRALVDWSHDLLSHHEQVLLRRLAVFGGSWSLEAAEIVCGCGAEPNEPTTLALLAELVDKSVVQSEPSASAVGGGGTRYRLLGPLREYAFERLRDSGEETAVRERHLGWLVTVVEEAESRWRGADEAVWLARIDRELDNIRAALDWSRGQPANGADVIAGLRLAASLWWYWIMRGHLVEGREHLRALLARADQLAPGVLREGARALHTLGRLTQLSGELPEARRLLEASLVLWREVGSPDEALDVMHDLGLIAHAEGDLRRAETLQDEVVIVARAQGDGMRLYRSLYHLGEVAADLGEWARAEQLLEEGLEGARATGDARGTAIAAADLGRVLLARQERTRAAELYAESIRLLDGLDDRRRLAASLLGAAAVVLDSGDADRAARLGGFADTIAQTVTSSLPPGWARARGDLRSALEEHLGAVPAESAWERGRALRPVEAMALATNAVPPLAEPAARPSSGPSVLSAREWEVAVLIAHGYSNPGIAEQLVISRRTADTHVQNILNKLGLHARAQIAAWAVAHGLTT